MSMRTQVQHNEHEPEISPRSSDLSRLQKDLRWQGRAARLICLFIGLFLAAIAIKYLLPCLVPFLLA